MASGLIILAEDEPKLRRLYSDFLELHGFCVVTATNGEEVLTLLYNLKPKLIILDIMMPKMDGIETCRQARKLLNSDIPIIFLTAADNMGKVADCMQAGGDDYIIKSESLEHILSRVRHWAKMIPRADADRRRDQALATVETAVVQAKTKVAGTGGELTSKTDIVVQKISEFVTTARSHAPKSFGSTIDEKLYLLGYVTGVVDHWSKLKISMQSRHLEYLRSVLNETDILTDSEIELMLDSYEELSTERTFQIAWDSGQQDADDAVAAGTDFVPGGLGEFAQPAAI
jgi:CheY-like chemotaxis protein